MGDCTGIDNVPRGREGGEGGVCPPFKQKPWGSWAGSGFIDIQDMCHSSNSLDYQCSRPQISGPS